MSVQAEVAVGVTEADLTVGAENPVLDVEGLARLLRDTRDDLAVIRVNARDDCIDGSVEAVWIDSRGSRTSPSTRPLCWP